MASTTAPRLSPRLSPRVSPRVSPLTLAVALPCLVASAAQGQFQAPSLDLPAASPAAAIEQTVGVTDMRITYHRPGVKDRTVWGGLVPWDAVWRAGANENTTISFSTPVEVEGKPLAAGTYGLHMIPRQDRFTVIFSAMADAWGSFSYDQAEDVLRVDVTPVAGPFVERLTYAFEEPTDTSVVVGMSWDKLRVPVRISVDEGATVLADIRRQLRGLSRFSWRNWNDAANLALRYGELEQASAWVDQSLGMSRLYANLSTKATILEQGGDTAAATALRAEAEPLASEADRNARGYELIGQKKLAEALAVFARNVELHPQSWNTHDSLAEALALSGDLKKAIASYERAAELATDPAQQSRIAAEIAKLRQRS